MKANKKNYKDIKIQEKDYEKLINFKREWNCSNLAEVVEELINYFEEDNPEEEREERYYCDNCGDYHD